MHSQPIIKKKTGVLFHLGSNQGPNVGYHRHQQETRLSSCPQHSIMVTIRPSAQHYGHNPALSTTLWSQSCPQHNIMVTILSSAQHYGHNPVLSTTLWSQSCPQHNNYGHNPALSTKLWSQSCPQHNIMVTILPSAQHYGHNHG